MSNRQVERGKLWAVTSFFNPAGYRRRLLNYRRFRAALQVPLAAVELSFDGRWELEEHDADMLVRVTDGDVMWQKERLLNVLVTQLPPACEYVAWIDADVLFHEPDWPRRAIDTLASVPLAQLFSAVRLLDHNATVAPVGFPSAAAIAQGGRTPFRTKIRYGRTPFRPKIKTGLAWAARRELLECHGYYDGCVIGGGDVALLGGAYGVPEVVDQWWRMSPAQRDHYSRWAARFHEDVRGRVGVVPGEIHHLWHGDLKDRRYHLRQFDLGPHQFDPERDIRPGADGAWRWDSDKPALHTLLRDYFQNRREDGRPALRGIDREHSSG